MMSMLSFVRLCGQWVGVRAWGVGQGGGRQLFAAQHACNFVHALFAVDAAHLAADLAFGRGFAHQQVVVCAGSHLGQVGHGQHLAV
jgi:hypothetical protein